MLYCTVLYCTVLYFIRGASKKYCYEAKASYLQKSIYCTDSMKKTFRVPFTGKLLGEIKNIHKLSGGIYCTIPTSYFRIHKPCTVVGIRILVLNNVKTT